MAQINLDVAQDLDITCRQGDTFSFSFTLKTAAGVAIDVTNYAFYMQVYKINRTGRALEISTTNTTDAALQKVANGNIVVAADADQTANTGLISITIGSEVMKTISAGNYNYELQFNTTGTSSGVDTTLLKGLITVVGDVTKIDDR